MPYTGVIERPDLQEIYLNNLPKGVIQNGDAVMSYTQDSNDQVTVELESGRKITGDVLIGADGIWSAVRAQMHDQPVRGDGSGATYSGYTVFAGELNYDSPDNGQVGYKVRRLTKKCILLVYCLASSADKYLVDYIPGLHRTQSVFRYYGYRQRSVSMVCLPSTSTWFRQGPQAEWIFQLSAGIVRGMVWGDS